METSCFLSCLSKYKGTCGNSRGVTESVRLEDCNESITNHLNTCHLSRETLTESQLILARAGIFDFPVSKLSETMICPKHRHTLGKYWKQRRPCQYPTHKGGKKAVKTRDVVNVAMEKEILKLHEVVVPIGSGLLSIFSHFYIITLSWRIKWANISRIFSPSVLENWCLFTICLILILRSVIVSYKTKKISSIEIYVNLNVM